jgi:hypothetical protein
LGRERQNVPFIFAELSLLVDLPRRGPLLLQLAKHAADHFRVKLFRALKRAEAFAVELLCNFFERSPLTSQIFNAIDQAAVVCELAIRVDWPYQLMLTRKTTRPLQRDIDMLGRVVKVDCNPLDQ